jgi:hypothetical protein
VRIRLLIAEAVAWWLFTLGLWCAFIGNISSSELVAGAAAGLISALTAVQLRILDWPSFRPAMRWVGWIPLLLATAIVETGLLARELWRWTVRRQRAGGEFRTVAFGPPGKDARVRAKHALATVAVSATPGSIVFQTYPELGEARVHAFGSGGPDLLGRIGETKGGDTT